MIFSNRFLCCNWYFYNVFVLLKDCFKVMLNKTLAKHFKNNDLIFLMSLLTFHYSFVQMFHKYFTGCDLDMTPMFEKTFVI